LDNVAGAQRIQIQESRFIVPSNLSAFVVQSSGSGAARLAAIPAGASPANTRSPVHVVVIPSGREGDQTAGSLEVKALRGRGDLVRSVEGGRATWQAVA